MFKFVTPFLRDKTNKLIGLMIPDIGNYEEDIVNL